MIATITAARQRGDRIAVHTYTVPVVRETPSQPPNASGDRTW
jgi:hypothetical protein